MCRFNALNALAGLGNDFGVGDVAEYLFVGGLGFVGVVGEFVVTTDVVLYPRIFGGFFLQLFDELGGLFVVLAFEGGGYFVDVCHGGWGNGCVSILADVWLVLPVINKFCFDVCG